MQSRNNTSYFSQSDAPIDASECLRLNLPSPVYIYYKVCREGRYYFMKTLQPQILEREYYRETLRKEYELGSTLQNEHIVRYRQLVDNEKECYVLMDYVNGLTLADFAKEHPEYFQKKAQVQKFFCQLLEALCEMHAHQALHLDLKPSNIMLTEVNADVRIIDLGCSYTDARPSTTGHTDRYAAPEQLQGERNVDARTDLYAVGQLLEEFGNGHYKKIAARCMEKEPGRRYQSAEEVLALMKQPTRRRWPIFLALALLLSAFSTYYYLFGTALPGDTFMDAANQDTLYFHIISLPHRTLSVVAAPDEERQYRGNITIPDSVIYKGHTYHITEIAPKAFRECHNLTSIHFPPTLTHIRDKAFERCELLANLHFPTSLQEIGKDAFANCHDLRNLRFPESIRKISRNSFVDCLRLRSVTIPEGVTIIHQDTFVGSDSLREVSLPSTLTCIERGAFFASPNLETITIPKNVTQLGEFLFYKCPSLREVRMLPPTPPYISTIVDRNFKGTILVPASSLQAYRNAPGWKHLNIQPLD